MTNDMTNSAMATNYTPANYRSSDVFNGHYQINTPAGIVHTQQPQNQAPPLPPRPNSFYQSTQQYSPYNNSFGYGASTFGYGASTFGNNYGGGMMPFNNSYGGFGGGFRSGFNSNPMDPETRFIQMAEESSRSAFQSIESIVMTIGNIASMMDSTYFALTSAFRALLGLAANFSHLRGFFTRFASTFTIFRSVIWMYKKLLYMIGISKINPTTQIDLNEAFKDAEKVSSNDFFNASAQQKSSGLPMILFLAFVFSAPYLIMKLFGSLMNSANDQSLKDPSQWSNAVDAIAIYSFNGNDPSELSLNVGQKIKIAPKEVQQVNRLLSTNWLMATPDGKTVGLVPVNYIKRLKPTPVFNQHIDSNMDHTSLPGDEPAEVTMEPVLIKDEPIESYESSC